ncbi:phage head-binding domain-containing protein [Escherichia coli]|uniref:phage head-binding domain-containing protein n=1 Tax=Escherichia coli TaxID=562 RepID=UPI001F30E580|nr:phage head-binding domain-containing protein [Escherichia coli]MCF1550028.1 phage head-binding domain-containing protein [Escherichia coli]
MSDITANVVVSMPSQLFTMARSFKAVANGKIYIGKIDTDPVNTENQIQVYVENEDGSHVPVSQPIIINAAGYPVYNGQIAKFVTVQGHSMAVYDAYGAQQFYYPSVLKYDPDQLKQELASGDGSLVSIGNGKYLSDLFSFSDGNGDALIPVKQPYNNTTNRTQHDKNAETLSILDFYIPNQTDWTQAFKNAARVSADIGKSIFVPAGIYLVSDSIPLYDDGYGTRTEPDIQSYYKGNGTQFIGEGRKTIIRKTAVSTKDVNAVFYINSTNVPPTENGKRGMAIKNMSILDLTTNSVGIYNNNGVVCSHFENLFIMVRYIGVWVGGVFVDVTFYGVIVQGHEDTATYPLRYGFRIGSGTGTSISLDRCHVGSCQIDAYEIRSQYSKIGTLSVDNCLGVAYVFREFRGHIQSLGSEWLDDFNGNPLQNGVWMLAESSQISIGLCSMLGKYSNSYLFELKSSTIKIDQVNATDNCVFLGSPARLRTSSLLDIGYFTQYKYEQFPNPIDYDGATNCFATVGDLGGTQYRLREGNAVYGMFKMPTAQPTGECYRIMGTKSTAKMSGCVGTITAVRGSTSITRAALMMDVVCNGNGNIGTSAIAVKRAVSDPVGLSSYTGWYEGTVDGVLYMMLKMDTLGDRNSGTFFTGTTIGRDPNLFRVVTPDQITGLVASSIGVMKTETAS